MSTTKQKDQHRSDVVKQLKALLNGGNAHATFDDAVAGLSLEDIGKTPDNLPYSIWQLTEHIRITQWDILEFSRDASHKSPAWPEGYWPKETAPADEKTWHNTIKQIKNDLHAFIQLLDDDNNDLYTSFPYGDGQNLFREALLIADHTSYHTAEIIVLRRLLGIWR